jgi:cobalt/nickel transport system permease protein
MHIHFLDTYHPAVSPVHELDERVKLILIIGFILATSLTPDGVWAAYILLFSLLLSAELLSGLGVMYFLKRSLIAFPFFLAIIPLLFTTPGAEAFQLTLGNWVIHISRSGLIACASVMMKSWFSVQAAVILASTTKFPHLLQAMRQIHIPSLLVTMIGMMWRYLFVLVDEAMRLMRARDARSGEPIDGNKRGNSLTWRAKVTGGMVGNIFLRSLERSDRIYTAMSSRGYDGEVRSLPGKPLQPRSWAVLGLGLAVLLGILFLGLILQG